MPLTDSQIIARCKAGMITPFEPSLVNPASLDVRLGPEIMIESAAHLHMLPFNIGNATEDSPFFLKPGQFILAHTIETFHMPDDVAAIFYLKSSRAREGLEHLHAGFIDPGFHGSTLTLELKNMRQLLPLPIWPGMKIGQITFYQTSERVQTSYSVTGNYNGHATVQGSKGHL